MDTPSNCTRLPSRRTEEVGHAAHAVTDEARDGLQESVHREPLQRTWEALENIPVAAYYMAMLGSIATAFGLFVTGKKESAQFVGQWAPAFALLGLMNKLLQPTQR
jgi:hypothetical protein